jgi:diguanylate cyclase (GGDEF)-like protein
MLLDENMTPVDCNSEALRLFNCPDKQRILERYWNCFMPEIQPDGQKSFKKAKALAEKVFTGERSIFEWEHLSAEGEPLLTEVTLTRLVYKKKKFLIVYIYDLGSIKKLEKNIEQLKTEVDKIYYDPLTGIYNRRYFDENLDRVIRLLSRSGGVISLMMIDIDYFKDYNDAYGHGEGDNCLKIIAETLKNAVRRADGFVARYGGEEFVIVLPNADEQGARLIADRILNNVRNRNIPHIHSAAAGFVTVSVGASTRNVKYPHDGDNLVKVADEMLYKSKRNGRNRYTYGTCDR